jgi:hypothetical protein
MTRKRTGQGVAAAVLAAAGLVVAGLIAGGGSAAAPSTGAVVARNLTRHTVVTASSGGLVRTLHVGARASWFRVGQVISLSRLTVVGHASRAEIRGTLIRHRAGKWVVSAGGSVLTVPAASARRTAGITTVKPGDPVDLNVSIANGSLTATEVTDEGPATTTDEDAQGDDNDDQGDTTATTTTTTTTTTTADEGDDNQGDDDAQGDEDNTTTTTTAAPTTTDDNNDQGDDDGGSGGDG